jgi:hypothetical protein
MLPGLKFASEDNMAGFKPQFIYMLPGLKFASEDNMAGFKPQFIFSALFQKKSRRNVN